jgi:hypothetical protein
MREVGSSGKGLVLPVRQTQFESSLVVELILRCPTIPGRGLVFWFGKGRRIPWYNKKKTKKYMSILFLW